MAEEKTKITLENENGSYAVEVSKSNMSLGELFEDLIEPVLLAAGYQQDAIDKYLE